MAHLNFQVSIIYVALNDETYIAQGSKTELNNTVTKAP